MARNTTTRKPSAAQANNGQSKTSDLVNPERYQGLRSGPGITVEYEANEATPVDGSNSLLRVLSPFSIQVEPPLVMGSEPASYDPAVKGSAVTGLYGTALKQRNGFTNARASLAMSTYVEGNYGPGTTEEIISRSSASRSSGGSRKRNGDGTRQTDATGVEGQGKTGEPAIADLRTAVDIASQLKSVLETPPLVLLINPQSLKIAYNKIQSYQDRTRFGYVFQAWGEEQPRLNITAKCGAFISGGRGVQWASRRDSAAWQNLMTAFQFYRNNGYIYDTVGQSNAHHFVGALSIRYDQWIYFGNMQSLSYGLEDSSTVNGGVTFEMEFIVTAIVDTASPSFNVTPHKSPNPSPTDPRYSGVENRAFNRPGEFSIGEGGSVPEAPRTGTSFVLGVEKGLPSQDADLQPAPKQPTPRGPVTRQVGTTGFQAVPDADAPQITLAASGSATPFGGF